MMERRHVLGFSLVYLLLFVVSEVKGTITPSGPISLDCGSQQTFTCSVTGAAAGWTITGLSEITVEGSSGMVAANSNPRIINTDTGDPLTSNITLTGFTEADNGGTVQCIELVSGAVQGMTAVSVGTPSCPTNTASTRNTDFTAATVTWSQPPNSPPITSTAVTYCPTSSPNCGNSVTCTSPCTINGLDPCMNYSVTVTPSNNCGSATGCTMNMVDSPSQGVPLCPVNVTASASGSTVTIIWTIDPTSPPVTSTELLYCPVSSPDCGTRTSCTMGGCSPEGLEGNTNYSFAILPSNECGPAPQTQCIQDFLQTPDSSNITVIVVVVVLVVAALIVISIVIAIIVICCCCSAVFTCFVATCCCCCTSAGKDRNKNRKLEPSGGEYADPQEVRDKKAKNEEKGITYAALEFSEQAGSTGGQNVRSNKGEAVQYMAVEQA